MKKNIKIITVSIIAILIAILLCVGAYWNLIKPIELEHVSVSCVNWDATYVSLEAFIDEYNSGEYDKDTTLIHNWDGNLPSNNPKDYMDLYIDLDFKNRNLFQTYSIDGYISNYNSDNDMLIYSNTMGAYTNVVAYRSSETGGEILATIYIANLNDDEIKKLVQDISLKIVAKGKFLGTQEINIELSDVEEIDIERK